MAKLPTCGLLSIADGRLMDDIGQVYEVISFFIGRPAYTHELPRYGDMAEPIIESKYPDLTANKDLPWKAVREWALAKFGPTIDVPDAWKGSLADGKTVSENLIEALLRRG